MWIKTVDFANFALRRSGMADLSGATAMEYALIGTGIGVALIATMFAIGDEMSEMFQMIQTTFAASTN